MIHPGDTVHPGHLVGRDPRGRGDCLLAERQPVGRALPLAARLTAVLTSYD